MDTYGKKLTLFEKIGLRILVVMMAAVLSISYLACPASVSAEERAVDAVCEEREAPAEITEEIALIEEALDEEIAAAEEEETSESAVISEETIVTIAKLIADILLFDINNLDPLTVSLGNYFSAYAGQFVFFGNWANGRSGSFGLVMGLHDYEKNTPNIKRLEETLKHEHGHYEQYQIIGLAKYIFAIAIPSMTHDPADYYSQPWEVTADLLGGVTTHYHSPGSEEAGWAYLEKVKNADLLTVIKSCLSLK